MKFVRILILFCLFGPYSPQTTFAQPLQKATGILRFSIGVPEATDPALFSTVELTARQLKITSQGKVFIYTRQRRFDSAKFFGYFSANARKGLRWPRNNRGWMEVGTIKGTNIVFTASKMKILRRLNTKKKPTSIDRGPGKKGRPKQRFVDLRNGSVKDTKTGLIWLKKPLQIKAMNWRNANQLIGSLKSGSFELSDRSTVGTWRLPTIQEFRSLGSDFNRQELFLFDYQKKYWSSTKLSERGTVSYWDLSKARSGITNGALALRVWPVRSGRVGPNPNKPTNRYRLRLRLLDNATGIPVSGAEVSIASRSQLIRARESRGANYNYESPGLVRGRYIVTMKRRGFKTQRQPLTIDSRDVVATIRLSRVPYQFQLRVLDAATKRPINGARVTVSTIEGRMVVKERNGRYTQSLQPGFYSVSISKKGYVSQRRTLAIRGANVNTTVSLRPSSNVPTEFSLRVQVLGAKDNVPISGATVTLYGDNEKRELKEKTAGQFAAPVKAGRYSINVSKGGYGAKSELISVGSQDVSHTVRLKSENSPAPDHQLLVRVIDAEDRPVPGLKFVAGSSAKPARSPQPGVYICRLIPGKYDIKAEKAGHSSVTHAVDMANADIALTLILKKDTANAVSRLFKQLDQNSDKRLDKSDFSKSGWAGMKQLDLNRNGHIESSELEPLTKPIGKIKLSRVSVLGFGTQNDLWTNLDRTKDGKLNAKDFSSTGWKRMSRLDANKNGLIERSELASIDTPVSRIRLGQTGVTEGPKKDVNDSLVDLKVSLDRDKNAKVEKADFSETQWAQVRKFDTNGDLKLSLTELEKLLANIGQVRLASGKEQNPKSGNGVLLITSKK